MRQEMRMPLAGRRQRPLHRFFGIPAIRLSGKRTALAVGRLCLLQLGHAAVPTGVEREQLRHAVDFLAQLLRHLFHAGIGPHFGITLVLTFFSIRRMIIGMPSLGKWFRMSSASA
jgi:hypothetical protein